jgi:mannose-6-phosphate isomerase
MTDIPAAPIRFTPQYHTRVWGGRRLETSLGRTLPDGRPYGESWELSDRADCQSLVATGALAGMSLNDLWQNHRHEIFGEALANHPSPRFPLLMKVLDCTDDLSIQVHPPADIALELGGEPKSEMWYFVEAPPGTKLHAGLRHGVTPAQFERALANGTVADCVHAAGVRPGDSLMVPSGRLHALGAGLLVFEIQQNSDTTYRVFDWNRVGLDGQPRQLHVRESLRCIDFTDFEPATRPADAKGPLAQCAHFRVERCEAGSTMATPGFRLIMALEPLVWGDEGVNAGSVAIWPACHSPAPSIIGGAWLEIHVR